MGVHHYIIVNQNVGQGKEEWKREEKGRIPGLDATNPWITGRKEPEQWE